MNCPICEKEMKKFANDCYVNDEKLYQCHECQFTYRLFNHELTISLESFHFSIKYNHLYNQDKEKMVKNKLLHRINVFRSHLQKDKINKLEFMEDINGKTIRTNEKRFGICKNF